jgi:hypothetical protein
MARAARADRLDNFKFLEETYASNTQDSVWVQVLGSGLTAACGAGSLDIVLNLLRDNRLHQFAQKSLDRAAAANSVRVVDAFLAQKLGDPQSAFLKAYNGDRVEAVERLVQEPSVDVTINNFNLIHIAAYRGRHQMFQVLMRAFERHVERKCGRAI